MKYILLFSIGFLLAGVAWLPGHKPIFRSGYNRGVGYVQLMVE